MTKFRKYLAICVVVATLSFTCYNMVSALPPEGNENVQTLIPKEVEGAIGGGGKTSNGPTDCKIGRSAKKNWRGIIVSCCGQKTSDMTGHYHS